MMAKSELSTIFHAWLLKSQHFSGQLHWNLTGSLRPAVFAPSAGPVLRRRPHHPPPADGHAPGDSEFMDSVDVLGCLGYFFCACWIRFLGMSENGVYPQWNSHLVGIMISKTIGKMGYTTFSEHFQTNPFLVSGTPDMKLQSMYIIIFNPCLNTINCSFKRCSWNQK